MGSWGAGVFQNDEALDFLDECIDRLERLIVYRLADEALTDVPPGEDGAVVAAADILALWCEHYHTLPHVSAKVVRRWHALTLQQFETDADWNTDQTADGSAARVERRQVIDATFDRLEAAAQEET